LLLLSLEGLDVKFADDDDDDDCVDGSVDEVMTAVDGVFVFFELLAFAGLAALLIGPVLGGAFVLMALLGGACAAGILGGACAAAIFEYDNG
jgi:hypothetical protein